MPQRSGRSGNAGGERWSHSGYGRPAEEIIIDIIDRYQQQYQAVRAASEALCAPLAIEDYGVQPMADASPPKWHLAHTTWFFETFLLKPFAAGYAPFDERYEYLFNSYYDGIGARHPRAARGLLSRPTVDEVYAYRFHVDEAMLALLAGQAAGGSAAESQVAQRLEIGLHHEQQHQELLLTDLKYNLGNNPLYPSYREDLRDRGGEAAIAQPLAYVSFAGGRIEIGADPGDEFCFDNETPRHEVLLRPFALADRVITNGEYLAFIQDGGYERPELWLSDGWAARGALSILDDPFSAEVCCGGPLYWFRREGDWYEYRLSGAAPLALDAPVTHISFYEADAFARWSGKRLPTEQEWEHAAAAQDVVGHFVDGGALHPLPAPSPAFNAAGGPLRQLFGDVWEWTASPYVAYPGYKPLPGTLGEYNGKFMSNQLVLRGGSCVTASNHLRASYRNFFYPADRWQFTGIRLAGDPT